MILDRRRQRVDAAGYDEGQNRGGGNRGRNDYGCQRDGKRRATGNALHELRREGAALRAVSLNAAPEDEQFMRRLLEQPADVGSARLPGEEGYTGAAQSVPRLLAALAIVVALALAALLGVTERLRWRTA